MELFEPPAARNAPSEESARDVISVVRFVPFLLLMELRGSCARRRRDGISPDALDSLINEMKKGRNADKRYK